MPPRDVPQRPLPWLEENLDARNKLKARAGDDLLAAYALAGAAPQYPIGPDQSDNPDAQFGTNFIRKPIEKFTLVDAMEESLGTDTFLLKAIEYATRNKKPLDLYGNLSSNQQWTVCLLLGKDPLNGKDFARSTQPPHVELQKQVIALQKGGESAEGALAVDMGDLQRKGKGV